MTGRRAGGFATLSDRSLDRVGLVALVLLGVVMAGCGSTGGSPSLDQVEAGVDAAERDAWEEAEFRWLKALAIDAENARALNNLAVRNEHVGEAQEAEERYQHALEVAVGPEREPIQENYDKFRRIATGGPAEGAEEEQEDGEEPAAAATTAAQDIREVHRPGDDGGHGSASMGDAAATRQQPAAGEQQATRRPVRTTEVTVAVTPSEGPNLNQYNRILVGNFVVGQAQTEEDLNALVVRFFRRRLVQRTFFQTIDRLATPMPEGDDVLQRKELWSRWAQSVNADLVFTGTVSMSTEDESGVVRERIRSPVTGKMEEVARFREVTVYGVDLDYVIMRAEDGEALLEGELHAEREFTADEGLSESEAITAVLEELLPEVLDFVSPEREEQTRLLIY